MGKRQIGMIGKKGLKKEEGHDLNPMVGMSGMEVFGAD